ncbi:hypothetical protein TIFTF001_035628 [Ficus carica]|uniref:Uncharacterized protein n=1 Tax=Ficus carica TaxID=3494 RepID=A0AA88JAA3_FICCA|nr:hypothetical protein TIFTF001_035628 [Ficus carica]
MLIDSSGAQVPWLHPLVQHRRARPGPAILGVHGGGVHAARSDEDPDGIREHGHVVVSRADEDEEAGGIREPWTCGGDLGSPSLASHALVEKIRYPPLASCGRVESLLWVEIEA